ncbi:MAG: EAL domain-containing protein [Proteobacteria bacterium]|nr:EAL domain-containing protein [Pseudomonadota bacterium]
MALTRVAAECNLAVAGGTVDVDPFVALGQLTRDAVVRVDEQFRLIWANRRARTLAGWQEQPIEGQAIDLLLPISSVEGEKPGLALRLSNPAEIRLDVPVLLRHSSGRRVAAHVKSQRLTSAGTECGWLFVLEPTFDEWRTQLWQNPETPALMGKGEFLLTLSEALSAAQLDERQHALLYLGSSGPRPARNPQRRQPVDESLLELCKQLQAERHQHCTIARLQADEFAILMHDTALEDAERRAQELLRNFRARCEHLAHDLPQRALNIGIIALPNASLDAPALLQEAFDASQQAREAQTQSIYVMRSASTTLRRRREEIGWMATLSRALDNDSVELLIEPIAPLQRATSGAEMYAVRVLLLDAQQQEIPSHRLLAAADRFQLLATLDRWTITHALRRIAALTASGAIHANSTFTLQLSAASLAEPAMLAFLRRRVLDSELAAGRLCFEVTESAALANALFATRVFAGLRQLGCLIALDNVGGTESSFAYLKNLPVDYLKLDAELVRGVARLRSDRAMIEAIQRLAAVMSIKTIAKEVDDETIGACLADVGIDYAQGKIAGEAQALAMS